MRASDVCAERHQKPGYESRRSLGMSIRCEHASPEAWVRASESIRSLGMRAAEVIVARSLGKRASEAWV